MNQSGISFEQLVHPVPLGIATALPCGVGFTMSLFVGSLALEQTSVNLLFDERLGIFTGSLLFGKIGYLLLHRCLAR